MRLRPFSRFVTSVTLAWVLGGCGKLDDLELTHDVDLRRLPLTLLPAIALLNTA